MTGRPSGWIDSGPGSGEPIAGTPPLVLLHGLLGDAEDWSELLALLSPERRCIAFDLPGHGARPAPLPRGDDPFVATVRWLASRLEEQGVSRFDLLGYSMGGRLVYGLVCELPSRVRRAVTIGASPGLRDQAARAERRALDQERARRLEEEGLEAFLLDWYRQSLFHDFARSPAFEPALRRRRRGRAKELAAALRALSPGVQPYLGEALRRTEVPLLLIAGARDEKYVAANAALAESVPASRARVVPDAGHSVHLERPSALARLVADFLDEGEE